MNSTLPVVTQHSTLQLSVYPMTLAESEAKFRRLVEDANDVITTWGVDGVITYLSPSYQPILGQEPANWVGKNFKPLVHLDDLDHVLRANQQVIDTKENISGIEFRHQHQQGHWIWVSINISPIKDDEGNVIAFQGIIRDIHDRKQYEDALRFMVEGTVAKTGAAFFQTCVRSLADIFQVQYAFVSELADDTCCQSRMLSLWTGEAFVEPYEFDLAGTPCQVVFQEEWGIFKHSLQMRFPEASALATLGAESYLGVVIKNSKGKAIGNMGIIDTKPLGNNLNAAKSILQIFATRVGAEMERYADKLALQEYADRQTLLNQLVNQIRNSLNLDQVITTTIESIRDYLNVDSCCFAWYADQPELGNWMIIQEAKLPEAPSFIGCHPIEQVGLLPHEIGVNRGYLQIDDVGQYEESVHQKFLQSIQIQSELLFPIQTQADRIGVIICTHYSLVRPWATGEIELLKAVRDQLAIAIDQAELYAESRAKSQELQHTLQELQKTQGQLVQNEKMSSLGQLVAGIAHEINNPVNFIHGNITHANLYIQDLLDLIRLYEQFYPQPAETIANKIDTIDLEFLREDVPKLLESMNMGTTRIREIVKSLRSFSRLDESDFKPVNIHDGLESTLMILQNRIRSKSTGNPIRIIKNYGDLPYVECFPGYLNQVFMNILVNAVDAVDEVYYRNPSSESLYEPTITIFTETIFTETQNDRISIRFVDNGIGMPEDIQSKIFDPFFTTKEVGKGTGMGMSISYQIITEKHGGTLSLTSIPGKGSEFRIEIPIHQSRPE
jgi:two-component system, NtrC family, sensor kinase